MPTPTRESHDAVTRWATIVVWQVGRVRERRGEAADASRVMFDTRVYDPEPMYRLDAEMHFMITAAVQLCAALKAHDGDLRIPAPASISTRNLTTLRGRLEHWTARDGHRSQREAERRGIDLSRHEWRHDGSGTYAGVADDEDLRWWAAAVLDEFRAGWTRPDHQEA